MEKWGLELEAVCQVDEEALGGGLQKLQFEGHSWETWICSPSCAAIKAMFVF